ncbi:MAG: hypothetical protein M1469_01480 [Bacteroidetes bacterium]|nr:hypothetical protein [Bacteroidota bacterium]
MKLKLFILAFLIFSGCEKSNNHVTDTGSKPPSISKDEALSIVNEVIDDFEFIHESMLHGSVLRKTAPTKSQPIVLTVASDSIFVYGDTATIHGFLHGMIVTEKHSHPKGLLLITRSSKYAPSNSIGIASVTERYISWSQYHTGTPELRTESVIQPQFSSGTDSTIEAHITRTKGSVTLSETFRFTSPIITLDLSRNTKTVRAADPSAEQIVTATYDATTGTMLSKRATGQADVPPYGGFYTQTYNYTSGELTSWVKTTTRGQADRSVLKIIERYP